MSLQPSDPASEAFERLRLEVALLRRAVEGLSAEGREPAADYSPTLAGLRKAVGEVRAGVEALGERPALVLTVEQLVAAQHQMITGILARPLAELERDRAAFARAVDVIRAAQRAELRRDQLRRHALALAAASAFGGALVWALALGPAARALPASWQVPERLAAATLAMPRVAAGEHLLQAGDPARHDVVRLTRSLEPGQVQKLAKCATRAAEAERAVRCTLEVRGFSEPAPS